MRSSNDADDIYFAKMLAKGCNMSVQYGRWNFDAKPIDQEELDRTQTSLAPYGPDGRSSYRDTGILILYGALHTSARSRCEQQPHVTPSGSVLTWDGRLDNRDDL